MRIESPYLEVIGDAGSGNGVLCDDGSAWTSAHILELRAAREMPRMKTGLVYKNDFNGCSDEVGFVIEGGRDLAVARKYIMPSKVGLAMGTEFSGIKKVTIIGSEPGWHEIQATAKIEITNEYPDREYPHCQPMLRLTLPGNASDLLPPGTSGSAVTLYHKPRIGRARLVFVGIFIGIEDCEYNIAYAELPFPIE